MIDIEYFISSSLEASSTKDLCTIFDSVILKIGIDYWAYSFESSDRFIVYGNYNQDWVDHYVKNKYNLFDPVIDKHSNNIIPFQWSKYTSYITLTSQQAGIFNEARDFGLYDGISIPIYEPNNRYANMCLSSRLGSSHVADILFEAGNSIYTLAVLFHSYITKFEDTELLKPRITTREKECLQWSAAGKTVSEIAIILGISNRAITFHLENSKKN